MLTIAMILNGLVVNTASVQSDWQTPGSKNYWNPGSQYQLIDITSQPTVSIGWSYDGTNFIAPSGN